MHGVLFGTTLLASFLGGVVALFAPCCVSVMLPAYLATGFRRRTAVLAATLVFAAGVATVIVPIGVGASELSALVSGHHFVVFSIGGLAMMAGGMAVLAGWKPRLPFAVGPAPGGHGMLSVYGLGVFSGAASSCCAPVLAGVAVLSGAAASFPAALTVSLTYVVGMVAPLAVIALIWDRRDWGSSRLLHGREITVGVGRVKRRMPLGMAASGVLLAGMGVLTVVIAFTGPDMGTSGWRVRMSASLQHWAAVTTHWLSWLPGWVFAVALAAAVIFLLRQARRRARPTTVSGAVAEVQTATDRCCADERPVAAATSSSSINRMVRDE